MKATEVRIGNFIDRNGLMEVRNIKYPNGISIYDHVNKIKLGTYFSADTFKGIPITDEWLFKLGWLRDYDGEGLAFIYPVCNFSIKPSMDSFFIDYQYRIIAQIKYVHELQNLYYILTGRELAVRAVTPNEVQK